MRLEGELDKVELWGKEIPIRIGQNWEVDGGVFEVSSISDRRLEGRTWVGVGKRLIEGGVVTLDNEKRASL